MIDSRSAFNPVRGTAPGDVGAAWYPFWVAAVMGAASLIVVYRSLVTPQAAVGAFPNGRASIFAVLKIVIPMLLYAASFDYLGFYYATAAFMSFFAAYIGRYKWYWVIAAALITPAAIYLTFDVAFRLNLPKSIFYDAGSPF